MRFELALDRLEAALSRPLPGAQAHARLAPSPRRQWPDGFPADRVRHAAGLLLVFPIDEQAHVLLTVRGGALDRHRGQVSLPGGVVEPGESLEDAALREAHEEVALPIADTHVLGALTPLDILVSGFRLYPILGYLRRRPTWVPARGEVDRILEIRVEDLLDRSSFAAHERDREGTRVLVPAFHLAEQEIWGATAMVLSEFLTLLGWPGAI